MKALTTTLLGCAVIAALWAVGAAAKGVIPKAFAYGAEIRTTVVYNATFVRDASTTTECTDGNGHLIKQTLNSHSEEALELTDVFKHITVPVVPAASLGAAAKRLALKAVVTTPGETTSDQSHYELSGQVVTDQNPCPQTIANYDCQGKLTSLDPLGGALESGDNGFEPKIYSLPVISGQEANPKSCDAIGDDQIPAGLNTAATTLDPFWGTIEIESLLAHHFEALRTKELVTWKKELTTGKQQCPGAGDGSTCTQSIDGVAQVKLKRLFLYRTKRSYPK